MSWQQTPDGRPGWAYYLIDQGYVIYMVDYPARGGSTYIPAGVHGDLGIRTVEQLETIWTNVGEKGNFPLKDNHTQWPGAGQRECSKVTLRFKFGRGRSIILSFLSSISKDSL